MRNSSRYLPVALAVYWVLFSVPAPAQQVEPQLSIDQQIGFLLHARVIKVKESDKGVTVPLRVTLTDGTITHDASFQSVNERRTRFEGRDGNVEMNFVDSYLYNLAAWELAKLLGIGDMMPVTVERSLDGRSGCLTWWLPVQMDEAKRVKSKIKPPDVEAWNRQMFLMRVFTELVYDTDRNLGNVLIGHDWKLYMIDFTRAFRLYKELREPKNLVRCSRALLERLRSLQATDVAERTQRYLNKLEIEALMARRDRIVTHFDNLATSKGAAAVLF